MDLVFSSRGASRCWSTARCSSRARPRTIARDPRVQAVYLGEAGAWLTCCTSRVLRAGYGEAVVLSDIGFSLADGRVAGAAGPQRHRQDHADRHARRRHRAITPARIALGGARHHARCAPERRAAAGIGWVPQERNIFSSLTVEENLTAVARPGRVDACERVFDHVPAPGRAARATSAASCRAASSRCWRSAARWSLNPRLLLLDEPLEGLAPHHRRGAAARAARASSARRACRRSSSSRRRARSWASPIAPSILDRGRIVLCRATAPRSPTTPTRLETHLGVTEQKKGGPSPSPPH